jgi:hypothetical protein
MNWHFLREGEAESWEGPSLDGAPSALSSLMPTPAPSSLRGNATACCTCSQSGTTSAPSTDTHGEATLMPSAGASPARTSASPAVVQASTESAQASGESSLESFARWSPDTSSWRTPQLSLLEGSTEFSETWPRWGSMRHGVASERSTLVPPIVACESGLLLPTLTVKGNYNTKEASPKSGDGLATALKRQMLPTLTANAYGSNRGGAAGRTGEVRHSLQTMASRGMLPTLTSSDAKGGAGHASSAQGGMNLRTAIQKLPTLTARDWRSGKVSPKTLNRNSRPLNEVMERSSGGPLNPEWCAHFMGWPVGWTGLEPLAMDRFQLWLRLHGVCCMTG